MHTMKKNGSSIFVFIFIFIFIFIFLIILFFHVTSGDEVEFEYDEKSEKGPSKWGDLKKEWEACKIGKIQSPIYVFPQRIVILKTQQISGIEYKPTQTTLKNSGHDVSLHWVFGEAGSITINGTEFFLQQVHWHIPSEHTINGVKYDMEMHMVHKSSDLNKIAVIGILHKLGSPDPFLHQWMKTTNISISEKKVGIVNPNMINILDGRRRVMYYNYIGSLTTPPCTEGVTWIIMKNVRSVSYRQVELLQNAVQEYARMNARPIQPLNERDINFYPYM